MTGLAEEMGDIGLTIQRAEDKTEKLKARGEAIDELVAAGTLPDFTGSNDMLDQELNRITVSSNVQQELAAMKAQLKAPEQKQLNETNDKGTTNTSGEGQA